MPSLSDTIGALGPYAIPLPDQPGPLQDTAAALGAPFAPTPKPGQTVPPAMSDPHAAESMVGQAVTQPFRDIYQHERNLWTGQGDPGMEMTGLGLSVAGLMAPPAAKSAELAEPLYSAVGNAVEGAKLDKAPLSQWMGYLKNQPGVKEEELNWLGLGPKPVGDTPQWSGAVSKQDLQDWVNGHKVQINEITKRDPTAEEQQSLDAAESKLTPLWRMVHPNQDTPTGAQLDAYNQASREYGSLVDKFHAMRPRYTSYVMPGGTNYRETLLTMPPAGYKDLQAVPHPNGRGFALQRPDGSYVADQSLGSNASPEAWPTEQSANSAAQRGLPADYFPGSYASSHWDNQPNILAHVRSNDRELPDGRKALNLEEIQSDWHQQGRKTGYAGDLDTLRDEYNAAQQRWLNAPGGTPEQDDAWNKYTELADRYSSAREAGREVPNAPFKQSWPDLALKRMVRHAAENGYDALTWTPGDVQAARYRPETEEGTEGGEAPGSAAARAQGMKGFYDKMLVDKANAIGKKYGAKVQQVPVDIPYDSYNPDIPEGGGKQVKLWSLPITPELKKAALTKGFPMFAAGGAAALGAAANGSQPANQQ